MKTSNQCNANLIDNGGLKLLNSRCEYMAHPESILITIFTLNCFPRSLIIGFGLLLCWVVLVDPASPWGSNPEGLVNFQWNWWFGLCSRSKQLHLDIILVVFAFVVVFVFIIIFLFPVTFFSPLASFSLLLSLLLLLFFDLRVCVFIFILIFISPALFWLVLEFISEFIFIFLTALIVHAQVQPIFIFLFFYIILVIILLFFFAFRFRLFLFFLVFQGTFSNFYQAYPLLLIFFHFLELSFAMKNILIPTTRKLFFFFILILGSQHVRFHGSLWVFHFLFESDFHCRVERDSWWFQQLVWDIVHCLDFWDFSFHLQAEIEL